MAVTIRDLSLFGARVEHSGPLPVGAKLPLRFNWLEEEVILPSETLRCKVEFFGGGQATLYNTGVQFLDRVTSAVTLRPIIAAHVARALEEQKANARGIFRDSIDNMPIFKRGLLTINRADFAETVEQSPLFAESPPAKESSYIAYRLEGGRWRKTKTRDPKQPDEGFTLLADEDPTQTALLCKTYEMVDASGRRLIRMLSELSILGEGIPEGRFRP